MASSQAGDASESDMLEHSASEFGSPLPPDLEHSEMAAMLPLEAVDP
jgi:hypothetical protein